MLNRQKRYSKNLKNTNKRNAIIIGIGLFIVISVTIWTVYRFMGLIS